MTIYKCESYRVIDRRKGLPVALGILYIETARTLGLETCGLNFPGHFLIRLQWKSGRAIVDPFNGGISLNARAMRDLLTRLHGPDTELTQAHYSGVSDLNILLRLQNNIKLRLIRDGKLERALQVIRDMQPARAGYTRIAARGGPPVSAKGGTSGGHRLSTDFPYSGRRQGTGARQCHTDSSSS